MSHYSSYMWPSGGYHGWAVQPSSGCCGAVMPVPGCSGWAGGSPALVVALEASADSAASSKKVFIGGTTAVRLTLEYMPDDGATAPSVTVTVVSDGSSTSTWGESSIAPGYHVKSGFILVEPGSKVTLEVAEASARLRWCETVYC